MSQNLANQESPTYTTSSGAPHPNPYDAQRVGSHGPLLLQDFHLIDLLAHFDRERIPERVVHAKGAGAHGYFKPTADLSDITVASPFQPSEVDKEVPVVLRFSTVGGESGSADTARDPRGFAIKLKTKEGNWDWVFNNTPVFFLRDPAKFPRFIHTQKRNPQTHLKDATAFWDYLSANPESIHQVMILFSDRGTPDGYRFQHGYSGHTFKWVNANGESVYVQMHCRVDAGVKTLTNEEAQKLAGENPDYGTEDLFNAIEKGDYPTWTVYIQTMTPKQAEDYRYNILDLTKVWPHGDFPLREIGKLVLNQNPENYFAEIEQVAFSPSHLIPGIEPSADPVLQSRLFSYPDTHRHRLGVNYQQLPINRPLCPVANFQRDGFMALDNQGSRPNYDTELNRLTYRPKPYSLDEHEKWLGSAHSQLSEITDIDFEQPRALWTKVFDDGAKSHFVGNVSGHLKNAAPRIQARQLSVFAAVDQDLSDRIAKEIGVPTVEPLKVKPVKEAEEGGRYIFRPNGFTA